MKMSDQMDILSRNDQHNGSEANQNNDCGMEIDLEQPPKCESITKISKQMPENGTYVPDSKGGMFSVNKNPLNLKLPSVSVEEGCDDCSNGKDNPPSGGNKMAESISPPMVFKAQPMQRDDRNPFQKPSVCRTHSLGAGDSSPFALRRRPGKLPLSGQLQSPSAFRRRKLCMQSPFRGDLLDDLDENVLKRCNSAPMLNELNDMDPRVMWQHGSVTPGTIRARRFSATVLSAHASPTAGTAKSTSRLHQLKKEESLEGIQHKETAHEREVQTSIQMFHTCEELTLSDNQESLNGVLSGAGDGPRPPVTTSTVSEIPRSPVPTTVPVNIPAINKQNSTRAIDFGTPGAGGPAPHHPHHPSGGGIPSPLTISPSSCLLSLSPLPPSPTRGLGLSSTGKQCFSPSMQAPVPVCLRPGSLSPSPSPTRRTFVTRRRSQSPCIMKPSALGPIKRKYDSDSEGGCSPKRMFVPGVHTAGQGMVPLADSQNPYPMIVTPFFSRGSIHRSHSLSSSSVDSDINVSPSPPQNGVNVGFLPANNTLGVNPHLRDGNNGSPFQSPLHYNPFLGVVNPHLEPGRCSSPASSTCSSSSLDGLKDLPPFSQNHLNIQPHMASNGSLIKPVLKDQQSSIVPTPVSTANVSL